MNFINETYFDSFTQNDLDEFLIRYKKIAEETANDNEISPAYCAFGDICEHFGLFSIAAGSYDKAIRGNLSNETAYLALIQLYRKQGLYYSQKKLLQTMAARFPGNKNIEELRTNMEERFPHLTVTAYIPAYNVEKFIAGAIDGLLAQSYRIDEILVIDDGSTDNSIKIARRYPVKIIQHSNNKGLGAARNTAIRHAAGNFLSTVDTDAVPDTFWLERLMLTFTDKMIGGVGGRLIEKNTATVVDRWRQVRMKQEYGDSACDNILLYGCNTVFSTHILRKIGGYQERYRTNGEDMQISMRIMEAGYKTRYNPDAVCRHLKIDTLMSAVDTCYDWKKTYFELNGAYTDIDRLKKKGESDIKENVRDINQLVHDKQFDILYPSYLGCIRSVFKDMVCFYNASPTPENLSILKAGYVILIYLLKHSEHISDRLTGYICEDIDDVISFKETKKDGLEEIKQKASGIVEKENDLNVILSRFGLSFIPNLDYVKGIFSEMSQLFSMNELLTAMVETGARRIRHEAEQSPYGNVPRVMILNPPWKVRKRAGVRAGSRWPFTFQRCEGDTGLGYVPYPFFIGYLSSILKKKGIRNVIVDAIAEELTNHEFIERVAGFEPDIIVMEVATASYLIDSVWLIAIKARLPNVKVIWTGTHATVLGEEIINKNRLVDYIVQGEYEKTTADLVEAIIEKKDYSNLKGLLFIAGDGKIVNNGRAEIIGNIDELPWPERLNVPTYKYNDLFAGMKYPSLQIHASRGCPFGCIYCVLPQVFYGRKKYRPRSPEKVVDEIETLVAEYGFKSVYFDDDTFNIGKERILRLCEEMKKRKLNIAWGAMARADTSDFETLAAMKSAGLVGIKFGVESGSQQLVDAAEKGLDIKKVEDAVKWCRELDIKTHLTFTFGLPGETEETINETIAFAKKMNSDSIQFSITTPFPGTKYYDICKQNGNLLTDEWDKFDGGLHTVIKSGLLSKDELEGAVRKATTELAQFKAAG